MCIMPWIVFNIFFALIFFWNSKALLSPKPSSRHQWGFCFRNHRASKIAIGFKESRASAGKGVNSGAALFPRTCCAAGGMPCPGRRTEGLPASAAAPEIKIGERGHCQPTRAPGLHTGPGENRHTAFSHGSGEHLFGEARWELQAGLVKVCGLVLGKDGHPDGWSDDCYFGNLLAWCFEPAPLKGAFMKQSLSEHGEAGKGPAIECPQAADPGCPCILSFPADPGSPLSLYHEAWPGWSWCPCHTLSIQGFAQPGPNHISPTPPLNTRGVPQICHNLEFGSSEYVVLLIWNILPCQDSSCSCISLVKLSQTPGPLSLFPWRSSCYAYLTMTAAVSLHLWGTVT